MHGIDPHASLPDTTDLSRRAAHRHAQLSAVRDRRSAPRRSAAVLDWLRHGTQS